MCGEDVFERYAEAEYIAELTLSHFASDNQLACMAEEFKAKWGISWLEVI